MTVKANRRVRKISARFMQRQELADLIGVNVETVKAWESDSKRTPKGWPMPLRIGDKVVLYDRSDVERFLQEARTEHPKAKPAEVK